MTPERADSCRALAAAYVHIPFCSAVCPYCDFAVVAGRDDMARRYVDALVSDISRSRPWRPLEAVYFGGGTPSHVDPSLLGVVLEAVISKHGSSGDPEITLEANPEDFDVERARQLRRIGFNRVSFGAQSFDDAVLSALGRRHRRDDIVVSVAAARQAGFSNISLDLIYGTPGESDQSWSATVDAAIGLDPDHLSAYALTVEPGTPLGRSVASGAASPDPDIQADRHDVAGSKLEVAGYGRYEVSNWSRPGRECLYNSIVWAQGEYEAYGNGAHGHRNGRRFRKYRRLDRYIEAVEAGSSPVVGSEVVDGWQAELERLFVGLRRAVGVPAGPGVDAFVASSAGSGLMRLGVVALESGRLVVRKPMLTDEVHRVVLDLEPPPGWAEDTHGDIVSVRENA